jgi:hypothetical protein
VATLSRDGAVPGALVVMRDGHLIEVVYEGVTTSGIERYRHDECSRNNGSATPTGCGRRRRSMFTRPLALAAGIARHGGDEGLRQAAAQALASLRGASLKTSGQMSRNVARRRFGAIRDALHALDTPRFGKRAAKRLHPDAGGSAREFTELSAARDALMKPK